MKSQNVSPVLSLDFAIMVLLSVAVHPVMATNGNSLADWAEDNDIKLDGYMKLLIGFAVGFTLFIFFILWLG